MSFPPEAYLIGAQKAGTTTLAYLLDQHPHISVARPKEPHFFTHNWDKGLDWYAEQFPDSSDAVCMDASTSYSMAPLTKGSRPNRRKDEDYEGVPARVSSINPGAKFIYLLRDPVERTYSGYWHNVRMGREDQEFRTALLNNPFYLEVSDYHGQLLPWLDHFPLRSFFFALFEDIKEAPERVARDCCRFLGVDEEVASIRLDSAKNQGYRVGWMGRGINRITATYPSLRTALKPLVPKSIETLLNSVRAGSEPIPAMKEEDREFLIGYFRERNQELERLIGTPLDRWQRE
jgi:hypothetical protein